MHRKFAVVPLLAAAAAAQIRPQYPEGAEIPRSLTPLESAWLAVNPLGGTDATTPPPTGPLRCPAEYEPVDGICIAWEGSTSWLTVLEQIAVQVTTVGQARIYCYCDTVSERNTVFTTLSNAGCDMSRVELLVATTDTIWIRDYGPRYVYEGDCRVIVDHVYNRPRPNDDVMPWHFGNSKGHRVYGLPLVHGGGNYHLDGLGRGHSTLLIQNENPTLTQQQIRDLWQAYQGVDTTLYTAFPTSVDSTQHIDMWMQVYGDGKVMISDWPFNAGSVQDVICDTAAASLAAAGWTVTRTPARSVSGVHYTYTNMVLCNDLALVPSYTNSSVQQHNAPALAAWQAALPGKTVVPINCQGLVTASGVMHCIVMHVPRHRGGLAPTAHVKFPDGGDVLAPNQTVAVEWLADDDDAVTGVDLLLSVNGGASFPYTLATGLPHTGTWSWLVPDLYAPNAKLRVVARDAQGREGHADSDLPFAIAGLGCQAVATPYGAGKPGSNGVPLLAAAPPVLGSAFALSLQDALPNGFFVLLLGGAPAAIPFDGGTILVDAFAAELAPLDAAGAFTTAVPLPDWPFLCGVPFYFQAWVQDDPGATGMGWAASNGVELVLGH
ncbi:MAG: agmatine deiminase family protein [Planctomycetes bacterium]|nr:agmatine deiminase family protein [Planctomycetota bacterium]